MGVPSDAEGRAVGAAEVITQFRSVRFGGQLSHHGLDVTHMPVRRLARHLLRNDLLNMTRCIATSQSRSGDRPSVATKNLAA
jgi:hypothetical protein